MSSLRSSSNFRWMWRMVLIVALLSIVACTANTNRASQKVSSSNIGLTLPGSQSWKQDTSSYLFGTNDTYEWFPNNIQTQPKIQQALRDANVTLIRTFFPDTAIDSVIEKRIGTIENSGAHCLGVITNILNSSFDEHLVRYLGNRCQLYEFGNEPDLAGISIQSYLQQWNTVVPLLRKINSTAKFIGPVTYNAQGNHNFMQNFLTGVKASKILPDAISFHWYPCWKDTKESCLNKASSYTQVAQSVQSMIRITLGKDLPVGISEWNYDPGNPPPAYGDDPQFIAKFTADALHAMVLAGVAFACQFDAASYSGYGRLDMFDVTTNQPKPQYFALRDMIKQYNSSPINGHGVSTLTQESTSSANTSALVSRGKPVYCTNNDAGAGGPDAIVSGRYGAWSFWRPSSSVLPSSCAIHIGAGPTRLLMTWNSDYSFDYIDPKSLGPQDYTVAVSADSTNGTDGTWQTVVNVTDNHTRVREHLFSFANQSWVKMTVTKGQMQATQPYVFIDQVDLYAVSASLDDTYFFSGDSITGMAYNRFAENGPAYVDLVHAAFPQRFPAMLNGGLGGWNSEGAAQNIDLWLALNPDIHYWLLGWGTNDALENVSPDHFRAQLQVLVDKIKKAGHVPVFAHIPYVVGRNLEQEVQSLNSVIDQITATNMLITGPDLYTLFSTHQTTYFLKDGIHPTPEGAKAMNLAWFQVLRSVIYK
ncbi:MAG: hypothetical protein NVS4B12_04140 [Ktedonobacteraceae bacterium]